MDINEFTKTNNATTAAPSAGPYAAPTAGPYAAPGYYVTPTPTAPPKPPKKHSAAWFFFGLSIGLLFTCMIGIVGLVLFELKNENPIRVDSGYSISDEAFYDKVDAIRAKIHKEFYQDISDDVINDAIYRSMLSSLDDPYSVYYTAEEWRSMLDSMSGTYYGIGSYVQLDEDSGYTRLTQIIRGTPAEASGLKDNDLLIAVNGEDVKGKNLDNVVALIKGPKGTTVTLTILRDGSTFDVDVTRDKIEVDTVTYEMVEDNIAYITITSFDEVTDTQFSAALKQAKKDGMKGLVVDIRANGGGYLDVVCNMLEELLPKGVIVYTIDKDGNREDYNCKGKNEIDVPMVVLADGNSASASEIFAGALKDYHKARLVGTTTFGKGIVQTFFPIGDGTYVKLTTSAYYTPSGVCIHGIGIDPDVEVRYDRELYESEGRDNQKERAIEEVKSMMK